MRFLRVTLTLQTLVLLIQAITAGMLLSSPGGRAAHSVTAIAVVAVVLVNLVAALVARQRAMIVPAVVMLLLTLAQMALGMAHMKTLHVPLGVLMFGGSLVQTAQIWASRRTVPAAA
ncbi:hypothetical protein ACIBEJ_36425 [Nonomuraea sp. NPDC050790]|uniref:hypothetical protein n=1 Tax=Nonomuraea sp. NPDC050790 TaxID=3364371 RepID=UPI003789D949